jgi:redox-sensitive bicupin YhaK (pirin superfamily)
VRLKRAFPIYRDEDIKLLDPFLLLDDFHSDKARDYIKGFPWHPHRGIETITYMLHGEVKHKDSLGNSGVIKSGDVQWMTAGSGIIHEEMPEFSESDPLLWGFQLWANLPAREKMMDPRYRDITKIQIPEVKLENGISVKIISGEIAGQKGPMEEIVIEPEYLDVSIPPNSEFIHDTKEGHTVFSYVIDGQCIMDPEKATLIEKESLVIFNDGNRIKVTTKEESTRFLLISGKPLKESVAWRGPIVMNTEEELRIAFEEYRNGTFLKHK